MIFYNRSRCTKADANRRRVRNISLIKLYRAMEGHIFNNFLLKQLTSSCFNLHTLTVYQYNDMNLYANIMVSMHMFMVDS